MRLATIRTSTGTQAARLVGDELELLNARDVGELLNSPDAEVALADLAGNRIALADADFAPLVPRPSKIICVGINYHDHILETGREIPQFPTLFAKFTSALIGAYDDLVISRIVERPDWEVELGVVIGSKLRRGDATQARSAIAGFTVINDVSMRDWQRRTLQWLQGKTFDATTPVGPFLVTPDEVDGAKDLELRCEVDGEVMQRDRTSQMVFGPEDIVAYCSQITVLEAGDIIATGTPGGIGDARTPPIFLKPGQVMRTYVEGVGECVNHVVEDLS